MFPRSSTSNENNYITSATTKTTKIHINPNFKRNIGTENPAVETPAHINPKFLRKKQHLTPSIHMNPNFLSVLPIPTTNTKKSCTITTISPQTPQISALAETITFTATTNSTTQTVQANTNTRANKYKLDKRPLPAAKPMVKRLSTDFHHTPRFKETSATTRNVNNIVSSKNKTLQTVTINGVQYNSTGRKLERKDVKKIQNNTNSISNRPQQQYTILQRFKLQRSLKNIETTSTAYRILQVKKFKLQQQLNKRNKDYVNSVKQRSLMMLRQRLVKSNVPCVIFQRLGKCRAHEIGRCNKVHSKKLVLTCKKFLRGECHNEKCLMSHDATFAKMPVCRFFLQALCTRDSCPYLHKKLNDNATICIDFLRGFCPLADKCNKRHEFLKRTTAAAANKFKIRSVDNNNKLIPKYKTTIQEKIKNTEKGEKRDKLTQKAKSCEKKRYFADSEKGERKSNMLPMNYADEEAKEQNKGEEEEKQMNKNIQPHSQRPKLGVLPAYIPIA